MKQKVLPVLIILSVLFFQKPAAGQSAPKWSVEEIFSGSKFTTKSLSGVQWIPGERKFSYFETDTLTKNRNLYSYSVADGKRSMVVDGALLRAPGDEKPMRIGSYAWSSDGKHVLITGTLPARRTKSGGNFGIYSLEQKTFHLLTDTSVEQSNITFSPDGKSIGFVRGNNLVVLDIASGKEKRLTNDGSETILNGVFDWVYEEEFSVIQAYQWSPDSRRIAFWRIDQSPVRKFPLVRYALDDGYANVEEMRYPKAGDKNSLVKIGVVDVQSGETKWMDTGLNPDTYIPRIEWTHNPEVLSIQRLSRGQDTLSLLLANVVEGRTRTILTETDSAWIDIGDDVTFLEKQKAFLWTSFKDGFTHIYLYDLDGQLIRQITRGDWEVKRIVAVHESRNIVYFTATQSSPLETHLYSIKLDGKDMRRLSKESGTHSINFSPDQLAYIDSYSSTLKPTQVVLRSNDGTTVATLIDNTTEMFKGYPFGSQQFFTLKASDGALLDGWMLKPADFDSTKRYPVLMYVYGLPGSRAVNNYWGGTRNLWHQLLAERGYIIVSVDPGTASGRGKTTMQQSYRKAGLREAADFNEAARYLKGLSYVDSTRIGVWGWSGGGYTTCMAMTLGADNFKAGIAVASVTDWRFYDTIFSERYMDTPQDNADGYKETSPITHASKLKGNLLIVHGTTDDNVHWQNSVAFVDELIKQNKQVQTMFYPGRAHGLGGAAVHLYTMMTKFLMENL